MEREQITMTQFLARLQAQGVPTEHYAFKCVHCGHVQSAASLAKYLPPADALDAAYSACEGRFNKGVGCDWSLGGLFQIHKLEVLSDEGHIVSVFEPASPEEAQALMAQNAASMQKCRVCGCDDFHPCTGGCYWAEDDLCSACVGKEKLHDQQ